MTELGKYFKLGGLTKKTNNTLCAHVKSLLIPDQEKNAGLPAEIIKLRDLIKISPGSNVSSTVIVKVLEISEIITTGNGAKMRKVTIADKTGSTKLTAWANDCEKITQLLKIDEVIKLSSFK